jgi:hypothetical protein
MDANIITIAIAKNETGFVFKLPTMKRFWYNAEKERNSWIKKIESSCNGTYTLIESKQNIGTK